MSSRNMRLLPWAALRSDNEQLCHLHWHPAVSLTLLSHLLCIHVPVGHVSTYTWLCNLSKVACIHVYVAMCPSAHGHEPMCTLLCLYVYKPASIHGVSPRISPAPIHGLQIEHHSTPCNQTGYAIAPSLSPILPTILALLTTPPSAF